MQSKSDLHVGIIMDGNGRWARARGLPRIAGHRRGALSVRRVVEAAPGLGVTTLTLYAFSADNWKRPEAEVSTLMDLLESYLEREAARCVENGVRLSVIGRRDRLRPRLLAAMERAEAVTSRGAKLHLRLAVDYSARAAILTAASRGTAHLTPQAFSRLLNRAIHSVPPAPDVDLLIRTSGEQRLSDFLLWESAYAELIFTDCQWPDFGERDLERAVIQYHRRERRYGTVAAVAGWGA